MTEVHVDYFFGQEETPNLFHVGELIDRLFEEDNCVYVHELGCTYEDKELMKKHVGGYVKARAIHSERISYLAKMDRKADSLRRSEVWFYLVIGLCALQIACMIYLVATINMPIFVFVLALLSTLLPLMVWITILKMSHLLRNLTFEFQKMGLEVGCLDVPGYSEVE